ncbi:MAG: MMPL family transporter [Polyangiales bacterium]
MKRSLAVLIAAASLTTFSAWGARRLSLDTSVEALLPANSVSVQSIEAARRELAIDEPLTILVASDDRARNEALVGTIAGELRSWPETEWVMTGYGLDGFTQRALYYVDRDTLEEWSELAEESLDWEACKASPLCVTIADPPELPDDEDVRSAVDASDAGAILRALVGRSTREPTEDASGSQDALCNDDGTVCGVQALLRGNVGNLAFASRIKNRAEAFIEPLERGLPEGTKIRVIGRYRVAPVEHGIIVEDLRLVSILAALGSLIMVLVFFRDVRALVQLAVPMLSGLTVAVGVVAWVDPQLNIISAAALAILAGMAIDFGIHLLMHYQSARAEGLAPQSAARASVQELWVSLLVAGVTTACGFGALAMTDFRGFSQMGWMASLGILVTLLWTLAIFPAVVYFVPGAASPRRMRSTTPKAHKGIAIGGLVLGALALPLAANLDFERNLAELQPQLVKHGIDADVMRARNHTQALFLGASPDAVERALQGNAMREEGRAIMGVDPVVVSSQAILPADAYEKTKILDSIRATLDRARDKATEREDQEALDEIDTMSPWLDIDGPPDASHLPPWLAATLIDTDGNLGRSGVLYVPLRGSNADAMERLAAWLDALRAENPDVAFASPSALLGEVTPALVRDAPWIVALVFLGLIVATGVASRSFTVTRDVFLATALTGVLFGALLEVLGLRLHLYNLLAIPVVIGLAVDGAVHVRWASGYADGTKRYATYKAVAASTLTSMVAFAALTTASHPGIQSLGVVGTLGLGVSLAVNLLWLPAWAAHGSRQAPTDSPSITRRASEL